MPTTDFICDNVKLRLSPSALTYVKKRRKDLLVVLNYLINK